MDQELLRYTMQAALYKRAVDDREKQANPMLDNLSKMWNDNPALRYGVYGAGAGAGAGLLANEVGGKEHPFQSMMTGAMGGAALGAGGKYLWDRGGNDIYNRMSGMLPGHHGAKGEAPQGPPPSPVDPTAAPIGQAAQRMGGDPAVKARHQMQQAAVGMSIPGPWAPGAALAAESVADSVRPKDVMDYYTKHPDVSGLPSSFGAAEQEYRKATNPGWDHLGKDVSVGAALGAPAGIAGGAIKDTARWLRPAQRYAPFDKGLGAVGDLNEKPPLWYSRHSFPDPETKVPVNELADWAANLNPKQQSEYLSKSTPSMIQKMFGRGPSGATGDLLPTTGDITHEDIRSMGNYSGPPEPLKNKLLRRAGRGAATGAVAGGLYRGLEKMLHDPAQEVLNEHPELFRAQ
jgi:hypothetical protein